MKYFVPQLALGALLPPQTQLNDKFGGLPYGSGSNVDATGFGDGGSGYLFINTDPVTPQGLFLWQCG